MPRRSPPPAAGPAASAGSPQPLGLLQVWQISEALNGNQRAENHHGCHKQKQEPCSEAEDQPVGPRGEIVSHAAMFAAARRPALRLHKNSPTSAPVSAGEDT